MKEMIKTKIRTVTPDDAPALLQIYSYYVKNTAISFEYDVPTIDEFRRRIEHTLLKYPYIAAEDNGKIIGYAYAGPFKERAAYDWAVETTIYVDKDSRGGGIGKALYLELESILKKQGILNLNACIAYTEKDDCYLTNGSPEFHKKSGYHTVGRFSKCGCKFGKWYDMIWMEKLIGEHPDNPSAIIPFTKL